MLFSVHLTVILWAFLKVITGFFTIISLFNFQGPTHFQGLFAFFIWSRSPQQCKSYYTTLFWFCQALFKSFLKSFFQLLKSKPSNTFDYFLNVDSPLPCVLTLFHRLCFLLSASPLSATVDIISALLSFVNPFLTIFLSFLHYRQFLHFKLTCCLFYPKIHYIYPLYTLFLKINLIRQIFKTIFLTKNGYIYIIVLTNESP